MTSGRILKSLIITLCLTQNGYGKLLQIPTSTEEMRIKLKEADQTEQLVVICFVHKTNTYDMDLQDVAKRNPTITVFKVDTFVCVNANKDFNVQGSPIFVFRKFGENYYWLIRYTRFDLDYYIQNYKDITREYGKAVITVKGDKDFTTQLGEFDVKNLLIVLYFFDADSKKEIDDYVEMAATSYNKTIVIFKVNIKLCKKAAVHFAPNKGVGEETISNPTFIYRKFKRNLHRLVGLIKWPDFHGIIMIYKDITTIEQLAALKQESARTKKNVQEAVVNSPKIVQCAKNDNDFQVKFKEAENNNRLIVLYFVENDSCENHDGPVERLAQVYDTIVVIKVDTAVCTNIDKKFPDEGETGIMYFPTFIVRKFEEDLDRIVGLDVTKLSIDIQKYKDAKTKSFDEGNQSTRWLGIYNKVQNMYQTLLDA